MNEPPKPPRYCPSRELPPYSYVPGQHPHPTSDPDGHSYGHVPEPAEPMSDANWRKNETWLWAIDLFNQGFYWEAHEAWEGLWHAAGRRGPTADFLKGLIKLAASGVKAHEGRPQGVKLHAARAAELLEPSRGRIVFGIAVDSLLTEAHRLRETNTAGWQPYQIWLLDPS